METEKEIDIDLSKIFKNLSPGKIFGLVLLFVIILVAAFYMVASGGQEGIDESQTTGLQVPTTTQQQIPEPTPVAEPEVTLYILSDDTCITCTTSEVLATLRQVFTNMKEIPLDYKTSEGKALAEKSRVVSLPAYIFDSSVEDSVLFPRLQQYLVKVEDHYIFFAPGSKLLNREEVKNRIDVFVLPTQEASIEVESRVKELVDKYDAELSIHIKAIEQNGKILSSLGELDAQEGIGQVCAMKYEGKPLDYIFCRNEDMDADWTECSTNPEEMLECIEAGEGIELMAENIKAGEIPGIGATPSVLFNNQLIVVGEAPRQILETVYCDINPKKCD